MSGKIQIKCPTNMRPHVASVVKGEYAINVPVEKSPVILDIGANVGSFAIWAAKKAWPGSIIHSYEPSKANFQLLKENIDTICSEDDIQLYNVAVGDMTKTQLFHGKNNCGESSLYQIGEQTEDYETVKTIDPIFLPEADILKMDTEGSEFEILKRIPYIKYKAILLEYHWESDRREIDKLLDGYCLVGGHARCLHRGVLKYLRNDLSTL